MPPISSNEKARIGGCSTNESAALSRKKILNFSSFSFLFWMFMFKRSSRHMGSNFGFMGVLFLKKGHISIKINGGGQGARPADQKMSDK